MVSNPWILIFDINFPSSSESETGVASGVKFVNSAVFSSIILSSVGRVSLISCMANTESVSFVAGAKKLSESCLGINVFLFSGSVLFACLFKVAYWLGAGIPEISKSGSVCFGGVSSAEEVK